MSTDQSSPTTSDKKKQHFLLTCAFCSFSDHSKNVASAASGRFCSTAARIVFMTFALAASIPAWTGFVLDDATVAFASHFLALSAPPIALAIVDEEGAVYGTTSTVDFGFGAEEFDVVFAVFGQSASSA